MTSSRAPFALMTQGGLKQAALRLSKHFQLELGANPPQSLCGPLPGQATHARVWHIASANQHEAGRQSPVYSFPLLWCLLQRRDSVQDDRCI